MLSARCMGMILKHATEYIKIGNGEAEGKAERLRNLREG